MKPIGEPLKFDDPIVQKAYGISVNAIGTADELERLKALSDQVSGMGRRIIGDLIESFVVSFGFPSAPKPQPQ